MSQLLQESKSSTLSTSSSTRPAPSPRPARALKAVYTIIDTEGVDKSRWVRVGTAYINRDQSLTVYLDALPVNHKLHIRDLPEQLHHS